MANLEKEIKLQNKLVEKDKDRLAAKEELDRERLLRVTGDLIETITSPAFVEKMRQARLSADSGDGMDTAAKLLSIDGLREAGVDIPADFRLTSRVFEDRVEGLRFESNIAELRSDALGGLAWGACGGAGGLTFCGCGGFST